jgi:hypothetical protein
MLGVAPAFADSITASAGSILSLAADTGSTGAAGALSLLTSPEAKDLAVYFAKTLIAWGIPVAAIGVVVIKTLGPAARGEDEGPVSLDGDSSSMSSSLIAKLMGQKPGEPLEYLKVQRLNDKLDSFRYSLQKAEEGPRAALRERRRREFRRAFGTELEQSLSDKQVKLSAALARRRWGAGGVVYAGLSVTAFTHISGGGSGRTMRRRRADGDSRW